MVCSKLSSAGFIGRSSRMGRPQLPHLGPAASRAKSTRLGVLQKTHRTTTGRAAMSARSSPSESIPQGIHPSAAGNGIFRNTERVGNRYNTGRHTTGDPPHRGRNGVALLLLSLIHISEPTRLLSISYAVFCLKKK